MKFSSDLFYLLFYFIYKNYISHFFTAIYTCFFASCFLLRWTEYILELANHSGTVLLFGCLALFDHGWLCCFFYVCKMHDAPVLCLAMLCWLLTVFALWPCLCMSVFRINWLKTVTLFLWFLLLFAVYFFLKIKKRNKRKK